MQYDTYDYALIEPGCTEYARKLFTCAMNCLSHLSNYGFNGDTFGMLLDMAFIAVREGVPDRDAEQVIGEMLEELKEVYDKVATGLGSWLRSNLNQHSERSGEYDAHNEQVHAQYNVRLDVLREANAYTVDTLGYLRRSKIRNRYMARHPREIAAVKALLPKLEAEDKALASKLDELTVAQNALDSDPEKLALKAEIEAMEARRHELGLFKFDEKKALDAELEKKREAYQAVLKRIEDARNDMEREEIAPVRTRIRHLEDDVARLKKHLTEPLPSLDKPDCYAELIEACEGEEEIPEVDIYPPADADIDKPGKYYAYELNEFRRCFKEALRYIEEHARAVKAYRDALNANLNAVIGELEANDTLGNRIGFRLRSLLDRLEGDETYATYEAYCDARKDVEQIEDERSRQRAAETLFTYAFELYDKLKALDTELETDDGRAEICLDAVLTLLQDDLEAERPFIEKLMARCGVDFASENSAVPEKILKEKPRMADDLPLGFPQCFENSFRMRRAPTTREGEYWLSSSPFRFALSEKGFQKAATWKEQQAKEAERRRMIEARRKQ